MRIFKIVEFCPECLSKLIYIKTVKEHEQIKDKIMKCPKCKVEVAYADSIKEEITEEK